MKLTRKGKFVFSIVAVILIILIIIGLLVGLSAKKNPGGGPTPTPPNPTPKPTPKPTPPKPTPSPLSPCPTFSGSGGSPIVVPNSSDDAFCTYGNFLFTPGENQVNNYPLLPRPDEWELDAVPHCIELCKNHPTCTVTNTTSDSDPSVCWGYDAVPNQYSTFAENNIGNTFTNYMSVLRSTV